MLYDNRLNSSAEDICAVIGYTATCALIEWYGGTRLWIPKHADENHEIAKIIGYPAFRALVREFGDTAIHDVPTDYFREVIKRDRAIYRMLKMGHGSQTIAGVLGITQRKVQTTRKAFEETGLLALTHPLSDR